MREEGWEEEEDVVEALGVNDSAVCRGFGLRERGGGAITGGAGGGGNGVGESKSGLSENDALTFHLPSLRPAVSGAWHTTIHLLYSVICLCIMSAQLGSAVYISASRYCISDDRFLHSTQYLF